MSLNLETLRELLVVLLDVLKRRWKLFLLPPLIALALGTLVLRTAPTKYVANSLILLQGANRATSAGVWQQPAQPGEQVAAMEAWLKSDQVLEGLLPAINGEVPKDPRDRFIQIALLRSKLSLEMVGGSVLDIRLEDSQPYGLGKKLEVIIARLLEALVGPDRGLFNASQFVVAARSDALKSAESALDRSIAELPSQPPEGVRTKLRQLVDLQTQPVRSAGQPGAPGTAEAIAKIRQDISPDSATVTELERLFAAQQAAKIALDATTSASNSRAYVGIFAAPENLVVIGRPHDPLTGQNPALKLVIAGLLLSVMIGAALVVASELLNGRLRMRREFEALTGLPVLARMPKITGRI